MVKGKSKTRKMSVDRFFSFSPLMLRVACLWFREAK
jgi:hypothetical protein